MADYNKISQVLNKYFDTFKELKDLGVVNSKRDFTSQVGEWLVAQIYNGQIATNGIQKDWDIQVGNKYLQVKTHSKSPTTTARWTRIKKDEKANITELIILVFSFDYKLKEFYNVPWVDAFKKIKKQGDKDAIYWDDIKEFKLKIDDLPNQAVLDLFK